VSLQPYRVAENRREGSCAVLTLEGEVLPSEPGQFYMLRGDWGDAPLLPRPFSILEDDPSSGRLRFLIKSVGEGTRRLVDSGPGGRVFGLGPLGRPFPVPDPAPEGPVVLVGGGVGVPPMVYLARRLVAKGTELAFFQGARSREELLLLDEIRRMGIAPELTTEDGSEGAQGLVTEPLSAALEGTVRSVCACGPEGMLRAVADLCRGKVPCLLSLEARMGCGYGVCLGCVVAVEEGGRRVYRRVCKEGPVFDGEAVEWE